MKDVIIAILVVALFVIGFISYDKTKEPTNNLQQEQINLDSINAYTTHKYDSVVNVNKEFEAKIVAKEYIILTLKGLVNDNNKKYQVITDSALVFELGRLRKVGIR
jgi:hypothetical protein